jgi:poly(hydroxyalkanoate) granule-associated protein
MAAKRKSRKHARAKASVAESHLPETVHQIWLAGLGAVARAQRGAPKLLDELISEGTALSVRMRGTATGAVRGLLDNLQENVSAGMNAARDQASDAMDNLEKMFRARVRRALRQLGVPSGQEIEALSKRVDTLNAHIGKLTQPRRTAVRRRANARGSGAKSPPPSMHAP